MTAGVFDLGAATTIYGTVARAQVGWFTVEHEGFMAFSLAIEGLRKSLGESALEEHWRSFLTPLNNLRWQYTITPLPFASPAFDQARKTDRISEALRRISLHATPAYVAEAEELVGLARDLRACADDPLTKRVIDLVRADKAPTGVVVLPRPTLQVAVAEHLSTRARGVRIDVITPRELASSPARESMVVLGHSAFYRDLDHVFRTPRAKRVMMLRWGWFDERGSNEGRFAGGRRGPRREVPRPDRSSVRSLIEARGVVPEIDWDSIGNRIGQSGVSSGVDLVTCNVWTLANGWAVATRVDSASDSTLRTVDPSMFGEARVREVPVGEIEIGDYVALRNGSGGDVVADLADDIIGPQSVEYRRLQADWKAELRSRIRSTSQRAVARELDATMQQVAYWSSSSPNRIGPGTPDAFTRLLRYLGMDEASERIQRAADLIRRAHIRAGRQFTESLVEVIKDADLEELERHGSMTVTLTGVRGAPMQIWRVEGRSPVEVDLPDFQVLRPIEVGDLWQG